MGETSTAEVPQDSMPRRFAKALGIWWNDRMPKAVEDEWMGAHQKIVDQLGSGKAKEVFLKLKDVFRLYGKAQGINTLVTDVVTAGLVGGLITITIPDKSINSLRAEVVILADFAKDINRSQTVRKYYARQRAPWAIAGALSVLALGPTRQLNRFAAKLAGDHVGAIVNRIVGSTQMA